MNNNKSSIILVVALAIVVLLAPASAFAQKRGLTRDEIIEANYSGPAYIYLDSYWTTSDSPGLTSSENLTNRAEVDVGPGDGVSTLAIVLINRGPSDIAEITGHLSLPACFDSYFLF